MLEITDAAVNQFKKILSESDAKDSDIRIFISGGGCCPSYGLDVTEKGEGGDLLIEKHNLKIYVESAAHEALSKATLDYKDGFIIKGMPSCCG
jgi:iron-sulfur cluster assembly protein